MKNSIQLPSLPPDHHPHLQLSLALADLAHWVEQFVGPLRFLPNHGMFSSDTFTVANEMLSETQLAADRRGHSSEKRS